MWHLIFFDNVLKWLFLSCVERLVQTGQLPDRKERRKGLERTSFSWVNGWKRDLKSRRYRLKEEAKGRRTEGMTEGEWQPSKTHKSWKHVGSATLKHTVPMSDSHTVPQTFNHHFSPYLSQFPLPLPLAVIIFYFRGIRQVQIAADTPAVAGGGVHFSGVNTSASEEWTNATFV